MPNETRLTFLHVVAVCERISSENLSSSVIPGANLPSRSGEALFWSFSKSRGVVIDAPKVGFPTCVLLVRLGCLWQCL